MKIVMSAEGMKIVNEGTEEKEYDPYKRLGRGNIDLDLHLLEDLASIACTQVEAAAVLRVHPATFKRKLKQCKYREAWETGLASGRASLRRRQWRKNSDTMLIWLGKQLLGQRDNPTEGDSGRSAAEEYLIAQKGGAPE